MFPGNPENGFFVILPNQSGVPVAVNLIDQPLSKLPVAATDRQVAVLLYIHICQKRMQDKCGHDDDERCKASVEFNNAQQMSLGKMEMDMLMKLSLFSVQTYLLIWLRINNVSIT